MRDCREAPTSIGMSLKFANFTGSGGGIGMGTESSAAKSMRSKAKLIELKSRSKPVKTVCKERRKSNDFQRLINDENLFFRRNLELELRYLRFAHHLVFIITLSLIHINIPGLILKKMFKSKRRRKLFRRPLNSVEPNNLTSYLPKRKNW
ncbi:CLUMA_CG003861, isoform A [Clunio marinus]|uniref:CLUMA_CG003861, isoform A n=1 Tax=Clunio marinus TaxID=568069 RepID=A0A1J1HVG3_9DIPT|nr:CLUMA_CG003861, isoform A [Clunio marinus]